MDKKYVIIPFMLFVTACSQQPGDSADKTKKDTVVANTTKSAILPVPDTTAQIVAGKRIGHISIGEPMENLITALGKPDSSDAGMGAQQFTWFSDNDTHGYRTDVYGHANFNGKDDNVRPVKLISVSSPMFKTSKGIGVNADYNTIKNNYTIKHVATYAAAATKIFDDVARGIGFEMDKNDKCVAVLVHAPGDSVAARISLKQGLEAVRQQ